MNRPFKERVLATLFETSKEYEHNFIDNKYYIYSTRFKHKEFYSVNAKADNFLHLTGVKTELKAYDFFYKCLSRKLTVDDFDVSDKERKGSVRRKISVLSYAMNIFNQKEILVEEKFIQNKISCSFATTDNRCTLGFMLNKSAKPRSLLKGMQLKSYVAVDLVVRQYKDDIRVLVNNLELSLDEIKDKYQQNPDRLKITYRGQKTAYHNQKMQYERKV